MGNKSKMKTVPFHIYSRTMKKLQAENKDVHKEYQDLATINLKLQDEVKQLTSLKKMCQAIVKYNENRSRDSEQYLVRRDMFERIVNALEVLKKGK